MMQDVNIDLGTSPGPEVAGPSPTAATTEKYYPSFYIDGPADKDLPDEGQMLITFRIRRQTKTKDKDGERSSCDIEVLSIDGVEGSDEDDAKQTPGDEFESRMKAHLGDKDEE